MSRISRDPAETTALPLADGGFLRRIEKLLKAKLLVARPKAQAAGLTPQLQYDIGMTDLRPLEDSQAKRRFDSYPGSFAAMLNRSI